MQVNPSEISFFLVKKTKAGALPMGQSWARGPHLFWLCTSTASERKPVPAVVHKELSQRRWISRLALKGRWRGL